MLIVKVVKINKKIEEESKSLVNIVEEKCYRSSNGKSEENPKSYVKFIKEFINKEECKPPKKNISKGQKTQEEDYIRDKQPIIFTHNEGLNRIEDHDQPKHDFIRTTT
jgi:hypothetical protein